MVHLLFVCLMLCIVCVCGLSLVCVFPAGSPIMCVLFVFVVGRVFVFLFLVGCFVVVCVWLCLFCSRVLLCCCLVFFAFVCMCFFVCVCGVCLVVFVFCC